MTKQDDVFLELARRQPQHHQLTREDQWAVSRKLLMAVWGVFFLFFTSQQYASLIDRNLTLLWVGGMILGALASAAGRATFQNLSIELPGLLLFLGGMTIYAYLVVCVIVETGQTERVGVLLLIAIVSHPQLERFTYLLGRWAVAMGWKKDGVRLRRTKGKREHS